MKQVNKSLWAGSIASALLFPLFTYWTTDILGGDVPLKLSLHIFQLVNTRRGYSLSNC